MHSSAPYVCTRCSELASECDADVRGGAGGGIGSTMWDARFDVSGRASPAHGLGQQQASHLDARFEVSGRASPAREVISRNERPWPTAAQRQAWAEEDYSS